MNKELNIISRQIKTVVLGGNLNSATTFTYDLKSLGFKPDYIIVRSMISLANNADEQVCQIYCNLISDIIGNVIISATGSTTNPQSIIDLREKSLNTNILSLSVQTLAGVVATFNHASVFSIDLEFHKL